MGYVLPGPRLWVAFIFSGRNPHKQAHFSVIVISFSPLRRNLRPMRFFHLLAFALIIVVGHAQDPCDVTLVSTPITCPDDMDGTLTVVANTPGLYTYAWSQDVTLNNPVATGLGSGEYSVGVIDTSGCFSLLTAVLESPEVPPLGTMTITNISCAGNTDGAITFNVNPGPYTWEWTDEPDETSNTRTGLGVGQYVVLVEGGLCPSWIFGTLGDPDIQISGPIAYCPSDLPVLSAQLDFGFQPDIYIWSTGDTTASFTLVPGTSGLVEVTGIDTSIGCVASGDLFITELVSPTVTFNAPDSACIKLQVPVNTILSDADSLVWRWGASGFSNEHDPLLDFEDPYWQPISLQGFDSVGCGSLPVLDSVFIRPILPAIFTVEQIPCTPSVQVHLESTSDSCAFFVGDDLVMHACSGWVQLDLDRYQDYDFTFYSTQRDLCNDTASAHVEVRTAPTLFLPTAFSPNGDGINETWPGPIDIPEAGYEVQIFDRWGESLWQTTDTDQRWDGASLPPGVYVYSMHMRDPCEPTDELKRIGTVTLVR